MSSEDRLTTSLPTNKRKYLAHDSDVVVTFILVPNTTGKLTKEHYMFQTVPLKEMSGVLATGGNGTELSDIK